MPNNDQNEIAPRTSKDDSLGQPTTPIAGLSPKASAIAMLVAGTMAASIGVYLTPLAMAAGDYTFRQSNIDLTRFGGAIWAVFGPMLPYVLLGIVAAVISRRSRAIRPIVFTAVALSIATCLFHIFSPMLRLLGERADLKGLAESPRAVAVFYCVVGIIIMYVILRKYGRVAKKQADGAQNSDH
jgi:hypothetical protein